MHQKKEEDQKSDGLRQLKGLGVLRREIKSHIMKTKAKNVRLVDPMKILGVESDLRKAKESLQDGVHLKSEGYNALAKAIISTVAEWRSQGKRKADEKLGNDAKKQRMGGVDRKPGNNSGQLTGRGQGRKQWIGRAGKSGKTSTEF
jgi:hypothetical protein